MARINSLDELRTGDVFKYNRYPGLEGVPFIVEAVGEVPGHEREIVAHPLYCPECPDFEVNYETRIVRNSECSQTDIEKLNKTNYSGWKYLAVKRVG